MRDVLIIGGAAMGWATAHHLVRLDAGLDIAVVEKDPSLRYASTTLSDGNVRVQFNLEENIAISLYAMECLENFADLAIDDFVPDPKMRRQGNLFLVEEGGQVDAMAGLAAQHRLGCDTRWLDLDEITARHPALTSEHLIGGTLGPRDGSVDPGAVVDAYRRNARHGGADLLAGTVESLLLADGSIDGVLADGRIDGARLSDGSIIQADTVVVCGGAWSAQLLATAGAEIPVDPIMRTVYVVAGDVPGAAGMPSIFLPSGVYVIPESDGTFLMAWNTDVDPVGFDFTPAPRSRFYDVIWPALAETLPAFDRLEVMRSWAGLYAQNRLDANGIIGRWPSIHGLFLATGFSGHGFQQCHAVGRYLAELITGTTPTLDLSRLGPDRILEGEPLVEHSGRII